VGTPVPPDAERERVHARMASTYDRLLPTMTSILTSLVGFRTEAPGVPGV
jgi:hypothetical protein